MKRSRAEYHRLMSIKREFEMFWKAFVILNLLLTFGCGTKQPKVTDEVFLDPNKSKAHLNLKDDCAKCHEAERPEPYEDNESAMLPHGENKACETCHTWPLFKMVTASTKAHNPYPKTCLGCHSVEKAVEALEAKDPKGRTAHGPMGSCKLCHQWPKWSPVVISPPDK